MLAQKHGKDGRVLEPARVVHAPTWLARTSIGFPTPPPSLTPPQTKLSPGHAAGLSALPAEGVERQDLFRQDVGEGLLVGDSILSIDGVDVRKWPLAKIGPALRGTRGACIAALPELPGVVCEGGRGVGGGQKLREGRKRRGGQEGRNEEADIQAWLAVTHGLQ